jgi:hypothetical protein
MADLYTEDGLAVLEVLEYYSPPADLVAHYEILATWSWRPVHVPHMAYCVIATPDGTYTDWVFVDDLQIEVA